MPFRVTPKAESDLAGIGQFIALDDIGAAVEFVEELRNRFRRLGDFPELGRTRTDIAAGIRSFPVGNYLIMYRVLDDTLVEIVRVLHGARDLPKFNN